MLPKSSYEICSALVVGYCKQTQFACTLNTVTKSLLLDTVSHKIVDVSDKQKPSNLPLLYFSQAWQANNKLGD